MITRQLATRIPLLALLLSASNAMADCKSATIANGSVSLLARIDAMATCMSSQQARIDKLEQAILVSEVPCADLGDGWQLYAPADGRFILGAGGKYALSKTGGEEDVKLKISHMPSHAHEFRQFYSDSDGNDHETRASGNIPRVRTGLSTNGRWGTGWMRKWADHINSAGGSQPHNNMPPYLALYFCEKT